MIANETLLTADMLGRADASAKINRFAEEGIVTAPEALEAIRRRTTMTPEEFEKLDWDYRSTGFTVARVESYRVIDTIRQAAEKAVEEGTTFADFRKTLDQIADDAGMTRLRPHHIQTIFRNITGSAYMAGKVEMFTRLDPDEFPLFEYDTAGDDRVRPTHRALDKTRLTLDEFIRRRILPPNGHRCRCDLSPVHRSEGLEENPPPDQILINEKAVTVRADDGWGLPVDPKRLEALIGNPLPDLQAMLRPTTIADAVGVLNAYQDAIKASGVKTTRIKAIETTPHFVNGEFSYETGKIGLSSGRMKEVQESLKSGSIQTEAQADAFSTLVHEVGHSLGEEISLIRYSRDGNYHALSQAVNDGWARLHFKETALRLGLDAGDWQAAVIKVRNSGYQPMMEGFFDLFEEAGFSRSSMRKLMTRLNLKVNPAEYEEALRAALGDALGVKADSFGHLPPIGLAINNPDRLALWIDEVRGLRRKAGKALGEIR